MNSNICNSLCIINNYLQTETCNLQESSLITCGQSCIVLQEAVKLSGPLRVHSQREFKTCEVTFTAANSKLMRLRISFLYLGNCKTLEDSSAAENLVEAGDAFHRFKRRHTIFGSVSAFILCTA